MELISIIGDAARKAGAIMLEGVKSRREVFAKDGHANFVTSYDKKVQDFLFQTLGSAIPEAHFLGEENGKDTFSGEDTKGLTFVIDPIDGTSNFMNGLFPSVTSIGLLKDGAPYLGVVYCPYADQLFSAEKGKGAFENGKQIHTSKAPLKESLVTMGTGPYYEGLPEKAFRQAALYMDRCIDIRRSGSAAFDLCMVAAGHTGLYFEPLIQLWDYCAGALICTEAGGTVTGYDGRPLPFNGPSSVVAASEGVAKEKGYLPEQATD